MAIRFSGPCCCGCLYFKDLYARNSDNISHDGVNVVDVNTYVFTSGQWHANLSGSGLVCDVDNAEILFYNNTSLEKNSVIMTDIVLNSATDFGSVLYGPTEIRLEGIDSGNARITVDGDIIQELRGITYPYELVLKMQAMPNIVYPNVNKHLNHKYGTAVMQVWYGGTPGVFGGIGQTATCRSAQLSDSDVSVDSYGFKAASGVRFKNIYAYNVPSGFTLSPLGWDTGNPKDMDRDGIANTGDMSWDQVDVCSFQPRTPGCNEFCWPNTMPSSLILTIGGFAGTRTGLCATPDSTTAFSGQVACNDAYDAGYAACGEGDCTCEELCLLSQEYVNCRCNARTVNIVTSWDYSENNGIFVLRRNPTPTGFNACDSCVYSITGVPYTVPVTWSASEGSTGEVLNSAPPDCGPENTRTEQFGTLRNFTTTITVTYQDLYAGITDTTVSCSVSGFTGLGLGSLSVRTIATACGGGDFCEGTGNFISSGGGSGYIMCRHVTYGFPCTIDYPCTEANEKIQKYFDLTYSINYNSYCNFRIS